MKQRSTHPRHGLSLVELTVVVGLMGLFILLVARTLWPMMRVIQRGLARIEMQQQGLVALNRIRSTLQASSALGISYRDAAPTTLSINRLLEGTSGELADATGNLLWRKDLDLFVLDTEHKVLLNRVWPPQLAGDSVDTQLLSAIVNPTKPKKLSSLQLQGLGANFVANSSLASGVLDFKITNIGPQGELHMPVQLEVTLQRDQEKLVVKRTVFLAGVQ